TGRRAARSGGTCRPPRRRGCRFPGAGHGFRRDRTRRDGGRTPAPPRGRGSRVRTSRPGNRPFSTLYRHTGAKRQWLWPSGVGKRAHPLVFLPDRHCREGNQRMSLFAKLSAFLVRGRTRLFFSGAVLAACLLSGVAVAASPAPVAEGDGYRYYAIGDLAAARPGPVEPGLMLVGGGEWPYDAFRWMIERAGHGHIVVLRASGAAEAQDEFYNAIGGIASAQTFVFSDRKAASDPAVLAAIAAADGIFIAGGDQSNYVRYW